MPCVWRLCVTCLCVVTATVRYNSLPLFLSYHSDASGTADDRHFVHSTACLVTFDGLRCCHIRTAHRVLELTNGASGPEVRADFEACSGATESKATTKRRETSKSKEERIGQDLICFVRDERTTTPPRSITTPRRLRLTISVVELSSYSSPSSLNHRDPLSITSRGVDASGVDH